MFRGRIKYLIVGNGQHGKDTCAEILRDVLGLTFSSSSMKAAEIFIFDKLKDKYGYATFEDCFNDRVNHREEWYDLICEYNFEDKARLAKEILKNSDTYVGMRDDDEVEECVKQGLFDLIIWVDASERVPLESKDSIKIDKSYADIILDNNGTEEQFRNRVKRLARFLYTEVN